jgi:hypothetical protein
MKRTIYLNTAINCNKTTNSGGTKNLIYSFDLPPTEIKNNSKLRVVSIIHTHAGGGSKLNVVFKIRDIQFNNNNYWGNDGFYPTILTLDTEKPSYYNGSELVLGKQTINFINLVVSDSLSDLNSGVDIAVNFSIILEIEE